jgi:acyl carrier protein
VESRIEEYIRTQFNVSATDPVFSREVDLFERGYVDSVGFVELIEFLSEKFGVEIPDEDLLSDDFSSVAGLARIVSRNLETGTRLPQ